LGRGANNKQFDRLAAVRVRSQVATWCTGCCILARYRGRLLHRDEARRCVWTQTRVLKWYGNEFLADWWFVVPQELPAGVDLLVLVGRVSNCTLLRRLYLQLGDAA
jgi:hypothetical protein